MNLFTKIFLFVLGFAIVTTIIDILLHPYGVKITEINPVYLN